MGIIAIAILAYVSSSEERREEVGRPLVRFMTEKRFAPFLAVDGHRHPGDRGRERLRPDDRSPGASLLCAHDPSGIAVRDYGSRQEDRSRRRREPVSALSRSQIRQSSGNASRTGARPTIGTASSATATPWPAPACSCTGSTRSRPTSPTRGRSPCCATRFSSGGLPRAGPGLPEEGGPWESAMPAWEKMLKEEEIWETILFLYDFTAQKPRAKEVGAQMTSRLIWRALVSRRSRGLVSRGPDRLVVCRADGIGARAGSRRWNRGAAGVGQAALHEVLRAVPRREGGR